MYKLISAIFIALGASCFSGTSAQEAEWAQVGVSVACVRDSAGHANQLVTQALMGQPLKIHGKSGQWYDVELPDGYRGWVVDNSLVKTDSTSLSIWRSSPRLVVTSLAQTRAYTSPDSTGIRNGVTDLVNGDIVEGRIVEGEAFAKITLPDGREGWVDTADVTDIDIWANQTFDPDLILNLAYSMEGAPYLWGGTSTKGLDCSGLVKVCYLANGLILERDAGPQSRTGMRMPAEDWSEYQTGDLLFFGNKDTGSVSHVAIYDSNGNYVHSSGRVKRNSIDPASPSFLPTPFLHAVRIKGMEDTPGIVRAKNHPWYFNK